MRPSVLRAGLATTAVGTLIACTVALGGPARAADDGASSSSDEVVIGCAVAGSGEGVSGEVVAPEGAALPVPADVSGSGGVLATATASATALPDGSVVLPGSTEPVEAFTVEISEEDLPDCSAAD